MADFSKLHCSFCGKTASEVKKLIEGPDVHICDNCIDVCYDTIHLPTPQSQKAKTPVAKATVVELEKEKSAPTPREIKAFLDEYVIGQDHAKDIMSVAVYNHYKRLKNPIIDGVEIEKSNILIFGPTGVGKTWLVQTVARMLDVPFASADATSLTEAGYVGEDVESIVSRLYQAADCDVKKTERGIIFLDEIDKKRSKEGGSAVRDVSGEGVQQALLKILEGTEVSVTASGGRKIPGSETAKVNTKNILFIVGGAFVGLDKIVEKALTKSSSGNIGFGAKNINKKTNAEWLRLVEPDHLVSFGIIPELVGRLPIITPLEELTESQLVSILTEPKHALVKQYVKMFNIDGVELEFTEDALLEIAKLALIRKTGGRGLRSVMEKILMKIQFNLPEFQKEGIAKIIIHEGCINRMEDPKYIWNNLTIIDTFH